LALAGPTRQVPSAASAAIARLGRRARSAPVLCGSVLALAVAAYATLYVTSQHAMANAAWEPHFSRRYVDALRASVRAVRERTGQAPVLIDGAVAPELIPKAFAPYNAYDEFVPDVERSMRFDHGGGPTYVLTEFGRLRPVRFTAITAGRLTHRPACVPGGRALARLYVPLNRPQTTGPRGLPDAVHAVVELPHAASVGLVLDGPAGAVPDQTYPATWSRGRDDVFLPVSVADRVSEIGFDLPAGACIESVALGEFDVAGPPQ
jgi:hypothetical protein